MGSGDSTVRKYDLPEAKDFQYLYRHFNAKGELLYVGISLNAIVRTHNHQKCSPWFPDIANITLERFETREQAVRAEKRAIWEEKPVHNSIRYKGEMPTEEQPDVEIEFDHERKLLLQRVVHYKPVYTVNEVSETLGLSVKAVRSHIDAGRLASFVVGYRTNPRWIPPTKPIYRVTGWQLIDFIESWIAKKIPSNA